MGEKKSRGVPEFVHDGLCDGFVVEVGVGDGHGFTVAFERFEGGHSDGFESVAFDPVVGGDCDGCESTQGDKDNKEFEKGVRAAVSPYADGVLTWFSVASHSGSPSRRRLEVPAGRVVSSAFAAAVL